MPKLLKTIGMILVCIVSCIIGIILAANDQIVLSFIGFFITIATLSGAISFIKKNKKMKKEMHIKTKIKNNKDNQDSER